MGSNAYDVERTKLIDPQALQKAKPLLTLLDVTGSRDRALAAHGEAVGALASLTAADLGLPQRRIERLHLAGVLHDVGKVSIKDGIINKPGELDDDEWTEIKRHPSVGYVLVRSVGLEDVATWVLTHHERPDGLGYPYGLADDEISIESSILSVADAYSAMIADRPYNGPLTHAEARVELEHGIGTQFDGDVVVAAIRSIERGNRHQTPESAQ